MLHLLRLASIWRLSLSLSPSPEPVKSFEIAAVEVDQENEVASDGFNITCTAIGVYPEPEIKLFRVRSINETIQTSEVNSNSTSVLSFRSMTDGLYSITLVSHFEQIFDQQHVETEFTPARARLSWPAS